MYFHMLTVTKQTTADREGILSKLITLRGPYSNMKILGVNKEFRKISGVDMKKKKFNQNSLVSGFVDAKTQLTPGQDKCGRRQKEVFLISLFPLYNDIYFLICPPKSLEVV